MRTGFIYGLLLFGSGYIFGLGWNMPFTKEAVKAAYDYGRESVIMETLANGELVEVASK